MLDIVKDETLRLQESLRHDRTHKLVESLREQGVPAAIIGCLMKLYEGQSGTVMRSFESGISNTARDEARRSHQPILLNAALAKVMRAIKPKWLREGWDIRMDCVSKDYLINLCFADDIRLVGTSLK